MKKFHETIHYSSCVKDKDWSSLFFMKNYQKLMSETFDCPNSFNWGKKHQEVKSVYQESNTHSAIS